MQEGLLKDMSGAGGEAYLSLGSNLGDREGYLQRALQELAAVSGIQVERCSSIYATSPVGYLQQPEFLNMAVRIRTILPPHELLNVLQKIEARSGRTRHIRWGPRTLDLDLLLYEHIRVQDERLQLPHPRMMERAFVLVPLSEIVENDQVMSREWIADKLKKLDGKDEIKLWRKASWPDESGRSAN